MTIKIVQITASCIRDRDEGKSSAHLYKISFQNLHLTDLFLKIKKKLFFIFQIIVQAILLIYLNLVFL